MLFLLIAFLATGNSVTNPPYGTTFNGYPFWEERASLVWVNMVRQAPQRFKTQFLPPASTGSFLNQPPARPLLMQYGENLERKRKKKKEKRKEKKLTFS